MELTRACIRLPYDLDGDSVRALRRALDEALRADAPVVLLEGASSDVFCLGLALARAVGEPATHAFSALLTAMHQAPKPLVAVVDGRAIGGGMGLACACDWLIASDRASFALPELLWGLVPAIIWPVVTDRLPAHIARHWTVTAHARSAAEARAAGLVDDVVPAGGLDDAVRRAVRTLRRLDPQALCRLRAWSRESRESDMSSALQRGADLTAAMLDEPRVRERWQTFADGGTPWSV